MMVFVLKSGGRMIYSGPLGPSSCKMVEYFESIAGVPKLPKNYNPATWMLEVSSTSSEAALGVDFAEMYLHSALYRNNKQFAETFSSPQAGSKDLYFPTEFPQNGWCQFKACLWKHNLSYWRSPSYNLFRLLFIMGSSLLYGGLFWQQGKKLQNQQNLFTVFGSLFSAVMVNGIVNCSTVMPYVSTERSVLYRERFSGMYASWAYALAQVVVEIPYILVQVIIFTVVTYPMIGYYNSGYKVFWYMYSTFSSLLFFNYAGMMLVSITPSFSVAVVLQSALFSVNYLFSGFLVPRPQIPKWWIWLSYLTPSSWTLNGILTSQYGDIDKEIEVFGVTKTVSDFLRDYYGFRGNMLPIVGIVLLVYPLLFASVFALSIQYLNFQKR